MTTLEPEVGAWTASVSTEPAAAPERLRSCRTPLRHPLWELVDGFAVALNRRLDRVALARALHRRALARLEYTDVAFPVGCQPGLAGLRIAFLADLHAGSYLGVAELETVFARVAEAEPDLVCFGGDLINTREAELDLLERPLRLLRPRFGCHAVPGNHDHRWTRDIATWQDKLAGWGVNVLGNRGVRIECGGDSLWLCGVDDLTDGQPDLRRALAGRARGEPTILLAHQPDHFVEAAAAGVDLTLSGHTHGGQVRLLGWAPIKHTRHGFTAGPFRRGDSHLYVSRGVGATVLPVRAGARPEVPIVRLVAG